MKILRSGMYWALMACLTLSALWTFGGLYAAQTDSSSEDQKAQDKKQEKNKKAQDKKQEKDKKPQVKNQGADEKILEKPEGFNINIDVSMVTTDVTVIGNPTRELNEEDFIILDDGVPQPATFLSKDQLPIAVALVIDASGSTRPFMPVMQLAGIAALRHLKTDDQATLYSFFSEVRRHADLTDDIVKVAEGLNKVEIYNGTALYDAIVDASNYLSKKAPNSRRAIILISDNQSYGSTWGPDQTLISLLENSITLYNVLAQSTFDTPPIDESKQSVLWLPKFVVETGGELFDVSEPSALQAALANAILNIRNQYTLGFNPTNPGKSGTFHKLEIRFASGKLCPGCRINTRKGYYTGVASHQASPGVIKKPARTPEETNILLVRRIIASIVAADLPMTDLTFRTQCTEITDDKGKPALKLDLQISAQQLAFRIEEGRHVFKLHLGIFSSMWGENLGTTWKLLGGRLSDDTYKQILQSGIPYSVTVPRPVEKHEMKIVAFDDGNDRAGVSTVTMPALQIIKK
jgi:Ca-activated chloride channel homolog